MGFRKISLQTALVDSIEKFIEKYGNYRSIAEFLSEAARLRMEQVTRNHEPPQVAIAKEA